MRGHDLGPRRPVSARQSGWARALAANLTRLGVQPNQVSLLSLLAAILGGAAIVLAGRSPALWRSLLFLLAAAFIQLRLLCNLLDGMIAVEGGRATKQGPIFNDLPDRLSDAIVLVSAGFAAGGPPWLTALGWIAALLAVLTAYVRALAGSLGATQDFGGPMAKQHRMQVISVACLLEAALLPAALRGDLQGAVMAVALAIVAAGSALTVIRRTRHLVQELESR